MGKIKLSDGRVFDVDGFSVSNRGRLYIAVKMPIDKAVSAFLKGTDIITFESDDDEKTQYIATGYTRIEYVSNGTECVRIGLVRPTEEFNG